VEKEKLQIVISKQFNKDLISIHKYGVETFGLKYADFFIVEVFEEVEKLKILYSIHPECRHLRTKSHKYHNIIIGSYLIIYRITKRVEVLKIIHGSKSPTSIKKTKSIKV
jgi:plasmid stabilization system protein ParE